MFVERIVHSGEYSFSECNGSDENVWRTSEIVDSTFAELLALHASHKGVGPVSVFEQADTNERATRSLKEAGNKVAPAKRAHSFMRLAFKMFDDL